MKSTFSFASISIPPNLTAPYIINFLFQNPQPIFSKVKKKTIFSGTSHTGICLCRFITRIQEIDKLCCKDSIPSQLTLVMAMWMDGDVASTSNTDRSETDPLPSSLSDLHGIARCTITHSTISNKWAPGTAMQPCKGSFDVTTMDVLC